MLRVLGHRVGAAVAVLSNKYCVAARRHLLDKRPMLVHYYNEEAQATSKALLMEALGFHVEVQLCVKDPRSGRWSMHKMTLRPATTRSAGVVGMTEDNQ